MLFSVPLIFLILRSMKSTEPDEEDSMIPAEDEDEEEGRKSPNSDAGVQSDRPGRGVQSDRPGQGVQRGRNDNGNRGQEPCSKRPRNRF